MLKEVSHIQHNRKSTSIAYEEANPKVVFEKETIRMSTKFGINLYKQILGLFNIGCLLR